MANYDKQFNVNKGLSVNGISVIDNNRNVAAAALTVTSTTLVSNLNAEMVGGKTVSLLGVTNANSVISGSWDFQTAPLFSGGAAGFPPFAVSAGSTMVSNLNAQYIADKPITSLGVIDAARSISATWTYTAAPFFNIVGAPFTVASTAKVANLNADLLDGANADTGDVVSTIAMRDSSGNLTAKQFSMTIASSARNTDTVFYSGQANDIYKNTLAGFKTSLGLNLVDNVSINSWTGSTNIATLGTAVTSGGKITANTFKSNVNDGSTPPFEVASTIMVTNLNANYINSKPSSDFVTVSGTSFYLGSTSIPLSSTTGQISYLTGVSISGSAGSAGSAGWVTNSLTFADATTWNGSAAKTLAASHVGAIPMSALSDTLTGTTINATTLQQGGTAISSLFMAASPGAISVTSTVNAGNYFKTTGTGLGNGFIVGSVTGGSGHFTTDANTTTANTLILTGNQVYIKNLANNAYKDLYAYNLYDYSSGAAVKVSTIDHTHTGVYLPLAGGTLTGAISGTATTMSGAITANNISAGTIYSGTYGLVTTGGAYNTHARIYQATTINNFHASSHAFKNINGGGSSALTVDGSITASTLYGGTSYVDSYKGKTTNTTSSLLFDYNSTASHNRINVFADELSVWGPGWTGGGITFSVGRYDATTTSSIYLHGATQLGSASGTNNVNGTNYFHGTNHYFAGTVHLQNPAIQDYSPSDIRLKTDIRVIDSSTALTIISDITAQDGIIGYKLKTDAADAKERLGVSAQIIDAVVPQATGSFEKDGVEYLTWHPDQITALLIAAVARLNERLTALEESIAGSV